MLSYSQASQDLFVSLMTEGKTAGTFLEIGSNHPVAHNNSFLMESQLGWRGLMVEFDPSFGPLYVEHRPRSVFHIGDAVKCPYISLLEANQFPEAMDYLQVDLDVHNQSTLLTLHNLDAHVLGKHTFATVTFEHDIYQGDFFDTRAQARAIFARRGYVLMFPDVQVSWEGKSVAFEDWYVHPSAVPASVIQGLQTSESLPHTEIVDRIVRFQGAQRALALPPASSTLGDGRPRVLFVNHSTENCGVYQYGRRLADILLRACSDEFDFVYIEVASEREYECAMEREGAGVRIVLYNYHTSTMPWLHRRALAPSAVHVGLPHESQCPFFDAVIDIDPTGEERTSIPRPLIADVADAEPGGSVPLQLQLAEGSCKEDVRAFIEYSEGPEVPIIGSFGFGFDNKGFHRIVEKVCSEYDRAIIKIALPPAFYDPNREQTVRAAKEKCTRACSKPGVRLMMLHHFLTDRELMVFLRTNALNLFLYDAMHGRGISSAIDYAMSARVPMGISSSWMFRHVWCEAIDAEKRSCEELIRDRSWIDQIDCRANNERLVVKMHTILRQLLAARARDD